MEEAHVDDTVERTLGQGGGLREHVGDDEAWRPGRGAGDRFGLGPGDRRRRHVDTDHVATGRGEVQGVLAGTAAGVEHVAAHPAAPARFDHGGLRVAYVPGRRAAPGVGLAEVLDVAHAAASTSAAHPMARAIRAKSWASTLTWPKRRAALQCGLSAMNDRSSSSGLIGASRHGLKATSIR